MAVVSTPPSMRSVISVFGGPGNLTAYYRGGAYVPNIPQNANIATSASSLRLSQFAGATNYVPVSASASPNSVSGTLAVTSAGSFTVSTSSPSVATGSNGTGSYTFSWIRVSGSTLVTANSSSNASTYFKATMGVGGPGTSNVQSANFVCQISDGTSSANSGQVTATLELDHN